MYVLGFIVCLTNIAYTAAFNTDTRCPSWVQYELTPDEIIVTNRISKPFRPDYRIYEFSNNAVDYDKSGYDRGHMAPAADFNFNMDALSETYLFTNICPQTPILNRGEWAQIEQSVRELSKTYGPVQILNFPIFYNQVSNYIGRVRVPDEFVKVVWGAFGVKMWRCSNHNYMND